MLLSIPLQELSRFKLTAKVNDSGAFSLSFQPTDSDSENGFNHGLKFADNASIFTHFDSSFEDGMPTLSVYITTTAYSRQQPIDTVPAGPGPESKWTFSEWRLYLLRFFLSVC
jgi:hypothetical protein